MQEAASSSTNRTPPPPPPRQPASTTHIPPSFARPDLDPNHRPRTAPPPQQTRPQSQYRPYVPPQRSPPPPRPQQSARPTSATYGNRTNLNVPPQQPRSRTSSVPPAPPPQPATPPAPTPTLDELLLMSSERISALSIGTLKAILWDNHVNARLILEKGDLVIKVNTLIDDERRERERKRREDEAEEERERLAKMEAEEQARFREEEARMEQERREAEPNNDPPNLDTEMSEDIHTSGEETVPPQPIPKTIPKPSMSAAAAERHGLCVICQDEEANIAIVDCGSSVDQASKATTDTFVTALVFNAAVFGIEIGVFTLLRPYFKNIYEPRTLVPVTKDRVKPLLTGMFTWPIAVFKADYKDILDVNGPDAYLFVRFLRMIIRILLPIWIISWAVLLPVTAAGTSSTGATGLDRFNFGNIPKNQQSRYAAHIILVWLFTFWVFWNIRYEMKHFITTRHLHLISPGHSKSTQANTVLVTGIPAKFLTEQALRQLYSHLPGGVKKVWINRDLKDLPALYDRRLAASGKLESAETSLLATAAKIRATELKKAGKSGKVAESAGFEGDSERDITLAERLVPRGQRPSHRLPAGFMPFSLPLIGKQVDTIDWCRNEIVTMTRLLTEGRNTLHTESPLPASEESKAKGQTDQEGQQVYAPLNSAFVTFNQQIAAHQAAQTLTHHEPYRMYDKHVEVAPEDVIWGNLGMNPYEKRIRMVISYSITAALIIFWSIPVAFVGIISNINGLCVKEKWLAWLCEIPAPVLGIIQGILPPVLLAVLMMLLPIVLRLLGQFEGIPTKSGLELSLMTRYFIFQVIHSFLIVTLASGVFAALPSIISNPTSVAGLLAQYLPLASTFFITYILLQGLSGVGGGFLAAVQLIIYYVKLVLLGSTPRSVYDIKYGPRTVAWGTLFPSITLLVVISLAYSIISPIINGFACAAFFAFYMMYKYLFLYQYTQPKATDTGGLFFPKAMQHIFVGLYVQQICLCALFFLVSDENGKRSAVPEGVLMVVLIIFTAAFNIIIDNSYGPLIHSLPLSLADKTYRDPNAVSDTRLADSGESKSKVGERHTSLNTNDSTSPISPVDKKHGSTSSDDGAAGESGDYMHVPGDHVDYGFEHPAASRPQRIVWIPNDQLGLGREEVTVNRGDGVLASTAGATMDAKGNVAIDAPPPDLGRV
ncbi:hypothetical protein BJ138DRAFT_1127011 [Hygrophoropsis aurantiaca]|uniref:Uncharacterized protein n=1 Tax=Hygrophoropsis aurantiaca TaxID=72124 RepID=A0ACB8AB60_9AGAM|nr:hypothetical protein BJ138DRAFT_1127011 [Hygrophoropsis aurantiaca]